MYGLFPTIAHIAQSPNGVKYVKPASVRTCSDRGFRLAPIFSPSVITLVTAFLVCLNAVIPVWIIEGLVRACTGQRRPASKVTTALITTPGAVASALSMAADEMRTIKDLDERCKPASLLSCDSVTEIKMQSSKSMEIELPSTSLLETPTDGSEMASE